MKKTSNIFSILSLVFFIIGSIYYSYIHVMVARYSMHKLQLTDEGFVAKFNFSSINSLAIISVLIIIMMLTMAIILIFFFKKNKYSFLFPVFSGVLIIIQILFSKYTILPEYMFAKYVLHLSTDIDFNYYFAKIIKYIPFITSSILGLIYHIRNTNK